MWNIIIIHTSHTLSYILYFFRLLLFENQQVSSNLITPPTPWSASITMPNKRSNGSCIANIGTPFIPNTYMDGIHHDHFLWRTKLTGLLFCNAFSALAKMESWHLITADGSNCHVMLCPIYIPGIVHVLHP